MYPTPLGRSREILSFVYLLPPTATFATARAATLQSARDLYGRGSGVEQALAEAWTAVGVR